MVSGDRRPLPVAGSLELALGAGEFARLVGEGGAAPGEGGRGFVDFADSRDRRRQVVRQVGPSRQVLIDLGYRRRRPIGFLKLALDLPEGVRVESDLAQRLARSVRGPAPLDQAPKGRCHRRQGRTG